METSPETCVLFSALQLCENQTKGGLQTFSKQNNNSSTSSREQTSDILTAAVDEIVNGLEFANSIVEKFHWKYEMTTILTALAIREEHGQDIDPECDLFTFLRQFPTLNTELLFDLICACGLELAFIKVLDSLYTELSLKLVETCISYIATRTTLSDHDCACVKTLFKLFIQYVFLHENSVLRCAFEKENKTIGKYACGVVEKLTAFVGSVFKDTSTPVSGLRDSVTLIFIGLLNFVQGTMDKTLYTFDVVFVNTDSTVIVDTSLSTESSGDTYHTLERNALDVISGTMLCQDLMRKYDLSAKDYCDVMLLLLTDDTETNLKEHNVPTEFVPEFENQIIQLLELFLNDEILLTELLYAKINTNVAYASTTEWKLSCLLGGLMRKLSNNFDSILSRFDITPAGDQTKTTSLVGVLKTVQNELKSDFASVLSPFVVSDETNFYRALVVIGEKLPNWEQDFNWLLVKYEAIQNTMWLRTMESNIRELVGEENVKLLWQRLVMIISHSNPEVTKMNPNIRELFLSVFRGYDIKQQNNVFRFVFQSAKEPTEVFGLEKTHAFAKMTVLLNRLVEVETNADVVSQIATLVLQCPELALQQMLKNAAQNGKQCDIIISLLTQLNAVTGYRKDGELYIYECLRNMLDSCVDFSEKQRKDFIYLIMKCVRTADTKNTSLLDFVYIWSRVLHPELAAIFQKYDGVYFYDDKVQFCFRIMATVFSESMYVPVLRWNDQYSTILALVMTACDLMAALDNVITPENIYLLDGCKKYLLETLNSLCQVLEWNFTRFPDYFRYGDFHWMLAKLEPLPWHLKGYLLPLLQKYFEMDTGTRKYNEEEHLSLTLFLPQCSDKILDLQGSESLLFTTKLSSYDNSWLPVLKLATVTDELCTAVCGALRNNLLLFDLDYTQLVVAMLDVLSVSIDIEWIRVATFLGVVCKKSTLGTSMASHVKQNAEIFKIQNTTVSVASGDSSSETYLQTDPILILFDTIFVMLGAQPIDSGVEFHIVKCFTRSMSGLFRSKSTNRDCTQNKSEIGEIRDSEATFEYLSRMCLLISRVSPSAQEQLISIRLEFVEVCSQYVKRSNDNAQGTVKSAFVFKTVQALVPNTVRDILVKKFKECGVPH